jgi:hypothetical protein
MSRKLILEDLLTQLETITVLNGYNTDIGLNADYWSVYDDQYNGPSTVTFCDREEDTEKVNKLYNQVLHIEITAIAYSSAANKLTDGCNLLDDLKKAIILSRWSDYALIVRPVSNTKAIEGKGKQAVQVAFNVDVEYREAI